MEFRFRGASSSLRWKLAAAGLLGSLAFVGGLLPSLSGDGSLVRSSGSGIALAQKATKRVLAPIRNKGAVDIIPDQYIVVFKAGTPRETVLAAQAKVIELKGTVGFSYWSALVGFSVKLSAKALTALREFEGIEFIEPDQRLTLDTVQSNPPQGLDRTSERLLPLDQRYTYSETGQGVHVYVLDRGIDMTHNEFAGRTLGASTTFVTDGNGVSDCPVGQATGVVGHGTFVAGIIAGNTVGIAKAATLHSVRVIDCTGSVSSIATLAAGIDWVTANRVIPAVANISIGSGASSVIDLAVTNAVAANVTVVVSAGNFKIDACTRSPARAPAAITVGALNPANDNLWQNPGVSTLGTNIGACVDLFAPGFNILSADISSTTATRLDQGTSFASPHVAGVAALFLQGHTTAMPAAVAAAITAASNTFGTTANWTGIPSLPANTVNRVLHWGSLNDGMTDGDPHITTVDGVHYDFQSAGEFVVLRDGNGLEVQTRQTAIPTTVTPGANPYTGLATCVSVNTAVAARVGKRRVTYQPGLKGVPDPAGLELRVDSVLTTLGAQGLDLSPDGRISAAAGSGIQIDFADGTVLVATPGWWESETKWYINLSVQKSRAAQGIMGSLASGSWLPALADGTSLGAMPSALHDRYVALYEKFADAWRVTSSTSLFDYAPGASTKDFTHGAWPTEGGPCTIPGTTPVKPTKLAIAKKACAAITDKQRNADCVFDVQVTGNTGFAASYQVVEKLRSRSRSRSLPRGKALEPLKKK